MRYFTASVPWLLLSVLTMGCAQEGPKRDPEAIIAANLSQMGADQEAAKSQRFCAIRTKNRLGAMGVPTKVTLKDQDVYLCCADCVKAAEKDLEGTIAKVAELHIQSNLDQLPPADRALARAQRFCASDGMSPLGTESMGVPVKIMVLGEPVFLCCAGCEKAVRMDEAKALELVKKLREESPKEQRPADRTLDLVKKLREENAKEQRPAGKDQ